MPTNPPLDRKPPMGLVGGGGHGFIVVSRFIINTGTGDGETRHASPTRVLLLYSPYNDGLSKGG